MAGAVGDVPPAVARQRITTMIRYADSLLGTPYVSGGGHAGWSTAGGLDCSGFVSTVLRSGGYLSAPQTTEGFAAEAGIAAGHGRFVTIYDRTGCGPNEHVIIDLNGRFYEAGGAAPRAVRRSCTSSRPATSTWPRSTRSCIRPGYEAAAGSPPCTLAACGLRRRRCWGTP